MSYEDSCRDEGATLLQALSLVMSANPMKALATRAVAACGLLARVQVSFRVWSLSLHRPFIEKKMISLPHPNPHSD
jgi:hypothetical protein